MPVTETSKRWSLLKARLDRTRPRVKVGIFGEAAAAKANDAPGATVGQIANAHEHGLGVPRRSWLADTVDANAADIRAGLRTAARALLDPKAAPGLEVQLLAKTGQHIAGLMRQRIASGIAPALSPGYLKRKLAKHPGATTPLIASGQMWGSIGVLVEGAPTVIAAQKAAARAAAKKALARRKRQAKLNRAARTLARAGKRADRALVRTGRKARREVKALARQAKRLLRRKRRRTR